MFALTFATLMLIGPGSQAQAPTPKPKGFNQADALWLASRVQGFYNKTTDFKAKFRQVYQKAYHGPQPPHWGWMYVKKPGLFRFEYSAPTKKTLVCDGSKVWIYQPANKQVFWHFINQSKIPSALSFLWGKGNIAATFWVKILATSKYKQAGHEVLKLVPKVANANYKHVLFVVNSKTAMVTKSIVYDHLGNVNHFSFSQAVSNSGVQKSSFNFTPPTGVRVIHASAQKSGTGSTKAPPRPPVMRP